jgi:elongation factor 3
LAEAYENCLTSAVHSRVGVIGPNGAGKSTMIKLLTGETEPQEGTVYRHPALRIGYVSQHATHHIERHLEKTPVQYIQWRYQDGYDRELLEKSTRIMTDEEREALDIDFVGKDGSKRKIEVCLYRLYDSIANIGSPTDDHGPLEAQEELPVRGQMARVRSQVQHLDPSRGTS